MSMNKPAIVFFDFDEVLVTSVLVALHGSVAGLTSNFTNSPLRAGKLERILRMCGQDHEPFFFVVSDLMLQEDGTNCSDEDILELLRAIKEQVIVRHFTIWLGNCSIPFAASTFHKALEEKLVNHLMVKPPDCSPEDTQEAVASQILELLRNPKGNIQSPQAFEQYLNFLRNWMSTLPDEEDTEMLSPRKEEGMIQAKELLTDVSLAKILYEAHLTGKMTTLLAEGMES